MTSADGRPQTIAHQASAIVLFDGVCNVCNASVQFILQRDPKGYFSFASLQSTVGRRLLAEHGFVSGPLDSVILIEGRRTYRRSTAALRILSHLRGAWPVLSALRIVPRPLRDRVYDWFASNRYRWFGKREECMIPTPELRQRFLE